MGLTVTEPNVNTVSREELIEQAFFFRTLRERLDMNLPMQDLLAALRDEVLSTVNLPMAIDFLLAELVHTGGVGSAMTQLSHYFTPFQAYVVREAEDDRGRFDLRVGLEILQREAEYRSDEPTRPGIFLYQFEAVCRNRLRYDFALAAMAQDPIYDASWRTWILTVRRQIGIFDLADLLYVRSQFHRDQLKREGKPAPPDAPEVLFGAREGKIAWANRAKDPLLLFSALQRQLGYPAVPRLEPFDDSVEILPQLSRRIERLEQRLKLFEEEQRGGIDITQFYSPEMGKEATEEDHPGPPS